MLHCFLHLLFLLDQEIPGCSRGKEYSEGLSRQEGDIKRNFERLLQNDDIGGMWSALHRAVPREVFTLLKLREPFPQPQTKNGRRPAKHPYDVPYHRSNCITEKTKILLLSLELSFSIQTKFKNLSQQVGKSRVKRPLQFQPDWLNDKQILS